MFMTETVQDNDSLYIGFLSYKEILTGTVPINDIYYHFCPLKYHFQLEKGNIQQLRTTILGVLDLVIFHNILGTSPPQRLFNHSSYLLNISYFYWQWHFTGYKVV